MERKKWKVIGKIIMGVREDKMHYFLNNELYHFGILGMKWGVRRFQKKDGSLTQAGKEHRKTLSLPKNLRKEGDDYVLEKGAKAYRIAGEGESYSDHKRKYMSVTDEDREVYQELVYGLKGLVAQTQPHYGEYINVAKKDLLIKNGEQVTQDLINQYGDNTCKEALARVLSLRKDYVTREERDEYYNEFINFLDKKGNIVEKEYERFIKQSNDDSDHTMVADKVWDIMEKHGDEVLSKYKREGYDAIIDPYDFINNVSDLPLIVLDPDESTENIMYLKYK